MYGSRKILKCVLSTWIVFVIFLFKSHLFPMKKFQRRLAKRTSIALPSNFNRSDIWLNWLYTKRVIFKNKSEENILSQQKRSLDKEQNRATHIKLSDYRFVLNTPELCNTDPKFLQVLILVPSFPSNIENRNAIRNSYGSISGKVFSVDNSSIQAVINVVFFVGIDNLSGQLCKKENKLYGDIIQADIMESYKSLTTKMLLALKWVSIYCSNADFVLKIDEDSYVNTVLLVKELYKRPYDAFGSIYGHVRVNGTVLRTGKWAVSKFDFPFNTYPNYVLGNAYVISGNIISSLFAVSEHFMHIPMEDVFITGFLARIIKAKLVSIKGFGYMNKDEPNPCLFFKINQISCTNVTPVLFEKFWKTFKTFNEVCATSKDELAKVKRRSV